MPSALMNQNYGDSAEEMEMALQISKHDQSPEVAEKIKEASGLL